MLTTLFITGMFNDTGPPMSPEQRREFNKYYNQWKKGQSNLYLRPKHHHRVITFRTKKEVIDTIRKLMPVYPFDLIDLIAKFTYKK